MQLKAAHFCKMRTAAPATCAAPNDVPLVVWYLPPSASPNTSTAGAITCSHKSLLLPVLQLPNQQQTLGLQQAADAGNNPVQLHDLQWLSLPLQNSKFQSQLAKSGYQFIWTAGTWHSTAQHTPAQQGNSIVLPGIAQHCSMT